MAAQLVASDGSAFAVNGGEATLGRDPTNTIVIEHPSVSRYHARLGRDAAGLVLEDLESANGTFVNGQPVSGPVRLRHGDTLSLGTVDLQLDLGAGSAAPPAAPALPATVVMRPGDRPAEAADLGAGSATPPAEPPATVVMRPGDRPAEAADLGEPAVKPARLYVRAGADAPRVITWRRTEPLTIGRADDSDITVSDDGVSRHHAEIMQRDGAALVRDLGSMNGTFVWERRLVNAATELQPGDVVMVGSMELVYEPEDRPSEPPVLVGTDRNEPAEYKLDRDILTLGSGAGSDIRIAAPDGQVQQARLRRFFADYWVYPSADAMPVLLNETPLTAPARLSPGDRLRLGSQVLIYQQQQPAGGRRRPATTRDVSLREVEPFAGLEESQFNALRAIGEEVNVPAGAVLVQPGKPKKGKKAATARDGAMYVLLSGQVEVEAAIAADWLKTSTIARLAAGDFFGERALAYGQPYPHRVRAVTPVRAVRFSQRAFERLRTSTPALGGFFKDKVARRGLVKYLREIPLFAHAPESLLVSLANSIKLTTLPAGDVLGRKGEVARSLFLVASGACRVTTAEQGQLMTLTLLTEGKYAGEQIAAAEETYPYSLIAETALEAYVLTRENYLALKQQAPEAFDFGALDVPPSVILQRTPPFHILPPEYIAETARELRAKTFRAGEAIISQDDPAGSAFYIIARGKVDVRFRSRTGEERSLAQIGPGQSFGEAALMTGAARNATVVALEDCQLLALYRREFNAILEKNPLQMAPHLGHTFSSRFRPRRIENVEVFEQHSDAGVSYILKNRDRNTYVSLSPQGYFIWNMLDGEHTMNDLAARYFQEYKSLAMGTMFGVISQLQQLGFLDVSMDDLMERMRRGFKPTPFQRLMMFGANALKIKVEFKRADVIFERMYGGFGKVFFTKPAILLLTLINIAGLATFLYLLITGSEVASPSFGGEHIVALILINAVILVTHEMGHGITMVHIGRKVLGAGFSWYLVMPLAYVNTTDAWLATKKQRLAVTAGGMLVTSTQAGLAALALPFVDNPEIRTLLLMTATFGYFGFLYNASPLLQSDGYNFLMDLLAIPDLRRRALNYVLRGRMFVDLVRRTMTREQKIFTLFGVIVAGYLAIVGLNMGLTVAQWLTRPIDDAVTGPALVLVQFALVCLLMSFLIFAILREAGIGGRKAQG